MNAERTYFDLHRFTPRDEIAHTPGDHPWWQESVVGVWLDSASGVGGFHRIGHEPNHAGGKARIWSCMFHAKDGWQYYCCTDFPLTPVDRLENGFAAGGTHAYTYDAASGVSVWTINDGDLSATIEMTNFFPIVDSIPKSEESEAVKKFNERTCSNHFECAGAAAGTVTYKGKTDRVEGFNYRDHSWAPRDWDNQVLGHRWFVGTLGPDLSFAAMTILSLEGNLMKSGFVVKDGEVILPDDLDIVVHMEADCYTHRGGKIVFKLPGGEVIPIRARAVGGGRFAHGNTECVEMICEAEGLGRKGFLNGEITTNPKNGNAPVLLSLNANNRDGITPFNRVRHAELD